MYCVPSTSKDDRHAHDAGVGRLLPQQIAGLGIEGAELAVVGAADEDETAAWSETEPNSCDFGKLCDHTFLPVAGSQACSSPK